MNLWKHEILWNFHYIFYLLGRVWAKVGFVRNFYKQNIKLITFAGARWFMERTSSFLTFIGTQPIQCEQTVWVSWNENFIFRFLISNTDHIIDVNQATAIHEYDTINIVCPKYDKNTEDEVSKTLTSHPVFVLDMAIGF